MSGHPNLSDEINENLRKSEEDGGVWLKDLVHGDSLFVATQNHMYRVRFSDSGYTIEGHPTYCPNPTPCRIAGSTWGGSMLKIGFVGKGMYLEFRIEKYGTLTTSRIETVSIVPRDV